MSTRDLDLLLAQKRAELDHRRAYGKRLDAVAKAATAALSEAKFLPGECVGGMGALIEASDLVRQIAELVQRVGHMVNGNGGSCAAVEERIIEIEDEKRRQR